MKYWNRHPNVPSYHWLFVVLESSAKREKKSLNFSFADFLTFTEIKHCHYCNSPITWYERSSFQKNGKRVKNPSAYNLDRKDNARGYSLENCVVCCPRCNSIKGNTLNYEQMLLLKDGLRKIAMSHA